MPASVDVATYVDAARLCASSAARQLGLRETGRVEVGALADLVVLDDQLKVRHTWLRGAEWRNRSSEQLV